MEHSLHCATGAVIKTVAPTPIHLIKKKLAANISEADFDNDSQDDNVLDIDDVELEGHDNDKDEAIDFDPKDILGKILAFVNQVHSSPQAHAYFKRLCVEENVQPLQLLKWVRT